MLLDTADIKRRHGETRAAEDSKDKIITVRFIHALACTVLTPSPAIQDLLYHVETLDDKLRVEREAINEQTRLKELFKGESREYKSSLDNMRRNQVCFVLCQFRISLTSAG